MMRVATTINQLLTLRMLVTYGLGVVFFAIFPLLFGYTLAGELLIFSIFAIGYNLMLSYGGELSFGHAAYFGAGAYITVLVAGSVTSSIYLAFGIGAITTTILGLVFGYISLQRRGIYFAMITLALAQMLYYVAFTQTDLTGGANGALLPRDARAADLGPINPAATGFEFYLFGLVMLVITWFVVKRIINSPFGRALVAVRDHERRAEHLGYNVDHLLLITFTMSSMISGFAGGLYIFLFNFVAPDVLFWTTSGEVVLMVVLGGAGTLAGPIVGAFIYIFVSDIFTEITSYWRIYFGAIIILLVLFAPQGVYGFYKEKLEERLP